LLIYGKFYEKKRGAWSTFWNTSVNRAQTLQEKLQWKAVGTQNNKENKPMNKKVFKAIKRSGNEDKKFSLLCTYCSLKMSIVRY
jgi:hypothetical protein